MLCGNGAKDRIRALVCGISLVIKRVLGIAQSTVPVRRGRKGALLYRCVTGSCLNWTHTWHSARKFVPQRRNLTVAEQHAFGGNSLVEWIMRQHVYDDRAANKYRENFSEYCLNTGGYLAKHLLFFALCGVTVEIFLRLAHLQFHRSPYIQPETPLWNLHRSRYSKPSSK